VKIEDEELALVAEFIRILLQTCPRAMSSRSLDLRSLELMESNRRSSHPGRVHGLQMDCTSSVDLARSTNCSCTLRPSLRLKGADLQVLCE
jgi:hypothetical protein